MVERHNFATGPELAEALAANVISKLNVGIANNGTASMAVSGGSTPALLFAQLAKRADIDWSKVTVTLVDERWVNDLSDRSNARLVRENLLQGHAASAQFVPLYSGGEHPDPDRVSVVNLALENVNFPFDVVILGMGNDGHTASFFPGGDSLEQALSDRGPALALNADGAGEPRITLTLRCLLNTENLFLHIEGQQKAATLDKASLQGPVNDMPIRAVLRQNEVLVHIYWCA